MKSSVITFPGSNCDRDMDVALKKFGFKNKMVWHADTELPKSDLVVLPGGFSYGDYLRCGSMASKSKIMQSVINFANSGGMVMGICNGFQILVETGLVPGVLLRNKYLEFICKNVFVKIKNKKNKYFQYINNDILEFHIAHNEGNYFCTNDQLKEIEDNSQIAINYCDENGKIEDNNQVAVYYCNDNGKIEEISNPNGSIKNIAGIFNKEKMKISVIITLKKDVLDPQGKVIHQTLDGMGFDDINEVRQGKYFEIDTKETDNDKAKAKVEDMCKKLLANLVIENYKIIDPK